MTTWKLIVAPFIIGCLMAPLLTRLLPTADALSCLDDEFWVLSGTNVQAESVAWPQDGHVYPGGLNVWAEGVSLQVEYKP